MDDRPAWETRSLEWIHQVRTEIDREIRTQGVSPADWVKARATRDVETLCRELGLTAAIVVKPHTKAAWK